MRVGETLGTHRKGGVSQHSDAGPLTVYFPKLSSVDRIHQYAMKCNNTICHLFLKKQKDKEFLITVFFNYSKKIEFLKMKTALLYQHLPMRNTPKML